MARRLLIASALLAATLNAWAGEARSVADDPALEARMMAIATELRCLVCQNQTVADSHAGLAVDLRQQIREQLAAGKTDEQVRSFMTDRYGDFVLYKPPLNARTALLWGGPALLSLGALLGLGWLLRRRARLPDEAFDPETPDEGQSELPRS
ncbi:cytochrome c-type biogenesis protein CcmH [Ideonella sp. 4Y16]|uniref:Cytochrome c-type biogenesis protein n=1 Tax=Ideonella alba TaxID=2824118 RepID=A0A940YBW1_9BURK|nr:cytochrome c-type biogenesis protein [Ideonella alba]MBQ0929847.1 cytochrome c-type biogenesis protein CcmH [Ideonella alba]MBQ0942079.1 cytochrome c-type biogenesis protein CcmH [Ideonella alba]